MSYARNSGAAPNPEKSEVVGHRGASGEAPENTLAAFELAWQQGAAGVELDVRISADRQVVVHHDATTARTAGTELAVAASDYRALRRLDVGRWRGARYADQHIPLLGEVLDRAPASSRVLIEIKSGPETAAPLAELLSGGRYRGLRLSVISFRLDSLLAAAEALPDIPRLPVCSSRDRGAEHDQQTWLTLARRHGFAGLDPDHRDVDAALADRCRAAGLALYCWTVNEPDEARRLARLGVTVLTSDWPARLIAALNKT